MLRLSAAVALTAAVLAVSGCGVPSDPAPPAASATSTTTSAVDAKKLTPPAKLRIPKIGAESSLVQVGLNQDGSLETPPVEQPMQAAWYRESPVPGSPGPAVIVGHVDSKTQPGVFFRLRELAAGDEVQVDGTKFVVTRTQQVDKDKLPTEEVFGNTAGPELRLITCGGSFDKAAHSYRDNIVVYAKAA